MHLRIALVALFLALTVPASAQLAPSRGGGGGGSLPISVGVGFSSFNTEMVGQRLEAPTVWADWNFNQAPKLLQGLGVEAEFRDLNSGQPAGVRLRQTTFGAGPIYTFRKYRSFHPYAKFLWDYGHMDFKIPNFPPKYTSDGWVIYAPGVGGEYRAWRHVWVRADYQYQFWRVQFFNNHFLNPQGITVGMAYDFGQSHAN